MWILDKPSLDIAKKDFDTAFPVNNNSSIDKDRKAIKEIYDLYDVNEGCTSHEYKGVTCNLKTKNKVKTAYNRTYEGKNLHYIRLELFKGIHKCPICSISAPTELDHFLPQSKFELLSINRQNLIPVCHICNNNKLAKDPNDFVHSYYASFPKDYFFIAQIEVVDESLSVKFVLLEKKIEKKDLHKKALTQIKEINLTNRLSKEIDGFLFEIFQEENLNDDNFVVSIDKLISKYHKVYGMNDWRTAFLIGIKNNSDINAKLINSIINRYKPNPIGA